MAAPAFLKEMLMFSTHHNYPYDRFLWLEFTNDVVEDKEPHPQQLDCFSLLYNFQLEPEEELPEIA